MQGYLLHSGFRPSLGFVLAIYGEKIQSTRNVFCMQKLSNLWTLNTNPKLAQNQGVSQPLDILGLEPLEGFSRIRQDPHVLQQVFVLALPAADVALAKVDEASRDEESSSTLLLQVTPEVKAENDYSDTLTQCCNVICYSRWQHLKVIALIYGSRIYT